MNVKDFNRKAVPLYVYDGTFDGLLCCLFSIFELKEIPPEVVKRYDGFLPYRTIESSDEKAMRVKRGIVRTMGGEALKYAERAYLSELLTAVIEPKANVLPLIAGHFESRFPQESFLIYDSGRFVALVYSGGKRAFLPL